MSKGILETLSGLAVRYLNEQRLRALRSAYLSARKSFYPLMKIVYGTFDAAELRAHLAQRIESDFEILMVHSSVNNMQPMFTDNALDLVKMLIDFCGNTRTLAMPAFYFGEPDIGGAFATFQQRPRFDLKRAPSQMGLATELFRRMPGVVQSRHPVYRVSALGPLAKEITAGHEFAEYPNGVGSPFDFMAKRNTRIIGIGKPFQVLTQAHHVEGLMGDEFPVKRGTRSNLKITVIDKNDEITVTLTGGGPLGRFNIWKLRDIMEPEQLQEWTFHRVPMFAARAAEVTSSLVAAAKRGVTLYE